MKDRRKSESLDDTMEYFKLRLIKYIVDHNITLPYDEIALKHPERFPKEVVDSIRRRQLVKKGTKLTRDEAEGRFQEYLRRIRSIMRPPEWDIEKLERSQNELRELFYKELAKVYDIVDE